MIPVLRDFYTPSTLTRTCWCGWLQVIKRLCALPGSALGVVPASVQRLDIRKKEKNLEDSAVYQKEMPDLPMAPSHLESRKNNVGSKQRCRSVNVCDKFFHPRNFLFPSSSSNRARDFFLLREIHKEIVQKKWIKSSLNFKEEKEICRRDLFESPWRKKLLGTKVGSLTITFSLSRSLSVEIATVWSRLALNRSTPLGKGLGGTEWELFATISPRNLLPIWLVRHVPSCVFSRARPMIRGSPRNTCVAKRHGKWEYFILPATAWWNGPLEACRNKHSGDSTVSFYWQVFLNLWGIKSPCGYF